jgi:uncharacterized peroxidase-related enzyme
LRKVKQNPTKLSIHFSLWRAYLELATHSAPWPHRPHIVKDTNMSRIPAIDPATAQGSVKTQLDGLKSKIGMIPNLYRVTAQSPAALDGLLALTGALAGGVLDPKLREQVALAVGDYNGCDYCTSAHTLIGKGAGLSTADIEAARTAHAADPRAQAALDFVRAVAERRGQVSAANLASVHAAGFSDAEVIELVAHVALNSFTNYVNNVADTVIDFPRVTSPQRLAA